MIQTRTPLYLLLALLIGASFSLRSQGTQEQFGQNRVQYKLFEWQYYESEHFVTYFNKGGQELGRFASQMAEIDLVEIEELLDYRINRPINIMIYNTIGDFNQSNIGAAAGATFNTGGRTTIIDNKLFIYYDGSHQDMRRQIREGIASILVDYMVFGGNLQEIVQNAVLLNLPEWFIEGLVAYIGEEWNADLDDKLRDGMQTGRYDKFNKLTGDDARFAGHSFWHFVAEEYGVSNIPNLLYLIRVNRSLENGFLFVLGSTVSQTIDLWKQYYLEQYEQVDSDLLEPVEDKRIEKRFRKRYDYYNLSLSPTGKHIAYVTDDEGRFKVRLQELSEENGKKNKKVKKGGFKTRNLSTDLSYPLIAWDRQGKQLVIVYEKRARTRMIVYNVETKEKEDREISRFQRIQHIEFTADSRKVVLSAINKGQTDIYIYWIPNARLEQITNDFYDDLDPSWVSLNGKEGIMWASNRDTDTLARATLDSVLPVANLDLYFLDYDEKRGKKALQITNTPTVSERYPQQFDKEKHFTYLSDVSGIRNRHAGYLDSIYDRTDVTVFFKDSVAFNPKYDLAEWQAQDLIDSIWQKDVYRDTAHVFAVSSYARNLREQSIAPRVAKSADLFYVNGRPEFYLHDLPRDLESFRSEYVPKESLGGTGSSGATEEEKNPLPDFYFQSEFPEVELNEIVTRSTQRVVGESDGGKATSNLISRSEFSRGGIRPYRIKYMTEEVMSQLDNSLLINRYQSFLANGGSFNQPDLNGFFTVSIVDLLEDYRFIGGFRIPTTFGGAEYFLTYQDHKRRLDWEVLHYYGAERRQYGFDEVVHLGLTGTFILPLNARIRTNISQLTLRWPFDAIRRVQGTFSYRNEKIQFLGADIFSLEEPGVKDDWISSRFEYVFDNTKMLGTNLPLGMRYKVWFEMYKGFQVNTLDGFSLSFDDGFLGVVGFDWRHYLRIHRNLIWANRVASGMSFGATRLIYYLGGVDSWIGAEFDQETVIDPEVNYGFQTIATNVRGFAQNARNGSSQAVINSEIRWPMFSYLINKPIRSELIRNFQLVGFFDVGSAWQGFNPFDDENRFNVYVDESGPVTTTVNFFQNPVIAGYGWGARTLLFGYFLRFDMAWGLDTGEILDPRYYFSLSLDF
jgi:hypothetical protein